MNHAYDAVLVLSFGGPEKPEDVIPFLQNVSRGRNIPRERLEDVAQNYLVLGGRSPINDQCRALIRALRAELDRSGIALPIYWGNRNWHPLLENTMRQMRDDGVRRAIVYVTSAYSSYSACRQYLEDLDHARAAAGPEAPVCDKLRQFHDHPGFLDPLADRLRDAFSLVLAERRARAALLFTAHSIPIAMAETSHYVAQIQSVAAHLAAQVAHPDYRIVWQSRSGPPQQPWLEPDIRHSLTELAAQGVKDVVVDPIGFLSDHMEVVVDLDTQARQQAESLGLRMVRAATVGTHPRFIAMIRELIEERLAGYLVAEPCLAHCCPNPHRFARHS